MDHNRLDAASMCLQLSKQPGNNLVHERWEETSAGSLRLSLLVHKGLISGFSSFMSTTSQRYLVRSVSMGLICKFPADRTSNSVPDDNAQLGCSMEFTLDHASRHLLVEAFRKSL